jgi:hypothetical protein
MLARGLTLGFGTQGRSVHVDGRKAMAEGLAYFSGRDRRASHISQAYVQDDANERGSNDRHSGRFGEPVACAAREQPGC